jgi:MFS family permease
MPRRRPAVCPFFAPDRYAQNYGLVFTAYGVGALLGTLATGRLRDIFGSYQFVFYGMALLAIVGMIVAWTLLRPRPRSSV